MMPPVDLSAAIIREPLTVPLKTPLLEAIALMDRDLPPGPNLEDDPSCVLVVDHQRVVGILTERDVMRLTIQQQPLGEVTVEQAMSRPVVTMAEAQFVDIGSVTQRFNQHCIRHLPLVDSQGLLAGLITRDSLRQVALAQKLQRSQRQAHLVAEMALRIRQHTQVDTLTTAIVEEVQSFLQADRVVVYQFQLDMSGVIVAESVVPPWLPCLDVQTSDTCFQTNQGGAYQQGRVAAIADVYGADLGPCYLELLEQFQVRANLVVPILLPKADLPNEALPSTAQHPLWGLLIAHQCSGPRVWDELDIHLLQRLSVQLAIALQQADLYQSLQSLNASLEEQVATRTHILQTLADRERMQANLATQIRASLDLETILETATREIRAILQCDRVNIWRFGDNWQPFVVAESTDSPLSLIGEWVNDTCLQDYAEIYRQGRVRVIPDIHTVDLSDCHREMLVRLQVRAKVLVPLLCGDQLWGLLNVTESSKARHWQPEEVELLKALSLQLAIAIQQATTYGQLQEELNKRQQTELRLREQEAKSRALLTAIPDYLFRVGADGEYRELITRNRDTRLLPVDLNPVGSTLAEVLPAEIAARHQHHLQQAIRTGELQVYEQCVPIGDDLLCDEVRVVKSGEDEALFMIRDISARSRLEAERKRLEAEREQAVADLRQSEQTNRAIIETMPDLLIRMDRQGYYSQISGGSEVQVKYPAAFPASEPDLFRVLPTALAEQRLYFVHQALETGQLQVYEQLFEVDGDPRWEEVRITPLNDQEVLTIIRDTTDSKRAVAALTASEQRFRQLFEATPQISVQGYDRDRRVIYWNPASEHLYGYSAVEALGQKLEELIIPPEMRDWVVAAVADWAAGGDAIPASELTLIDKWGNPVEVFSSHVLINNLAGEPEMYCIDINLSPLRQAQTQLRQLNQTLEAKVIERTAALEEREARYRALVNVIPDLLIRIDADGTYLDVITGDGVELFNPDQIEQGVNIYDVTPFAHAQERMGYVHQALQTREAQSYDYELTINGQQISETARIVAINDTEALIIVQDISERTRLVAEVADRTAALQASEAQLRAMIEAIPDLLLRVTPDGTCLGSMYPSDNAQEFLPIQQHLSEVLPPELLQQQLYAIERAVATGNVQVYEHQFQKGDRMVYEEVRVSAISPEQVLLMIRDITQRKQIEKALHESQRFLQTVLDTVPMPIFWKDRNSVFLGGTQKLLNAVGLQSEADLIGKTDFDLPATQDRAIAYRADDQQVMESGIARLGIVETLTGPDGQQNWLETHKAPLRDWAGEVIGVVGIFQDITQRKQAEIDLQAKTEELDRFFALALDLLCIVDGEGRFIRLNHQWEQTLGYPLAEIQGSRYMDYVHPDDVDRTLAASRQLAENKTLFNFANRYRCRDGSYRWLEWQSVLSHNLIYATARDITVRKQVEVELQTKNQEIQQAYQDLKAAQLQLVQSEKMSSLGQLVAGIAHEINNPVSFIYGNLNAALNYTQDLTTLLTLYQSHYAEPPKQITEFIKTADITYVLGDFPKLLKSMENGAVRIRDIVASLRTFSHLDQAERKAIDLHENIDSTLVILQNRLNGRAGNPEIQVIKNYGDIPPVECYGGSLNQVFMNLLVNAIDAIEARQAQGSESNSGQITITTQVTTAEKVAIAIQDNGIGMEASTQAKIFDPFYTTKPVGIGTGMGLSISYQIVTNDHHGQLTCDSVLGEGTTFTIEL
jgi:two-component system NtrC family sensor kinase